MQFETLFDGIFEHNYFENGKTAGFHGDLQVHGSLASWCGGYQPWMDFHMPRAWRVVMVSDPMPRMASMFYFKHGYTKPISTDTGDVIRENADVMHADPKSRQSLQLIGEFLHEFETKSRWGMTQWYWLREGTPNRNLPDVLQMLRNGAFLVGLTERFDESLLLWRHFMGLFIEDILYFDQKSDLLHPNISEWRVDHQQQARVISHRTGDMQYYGVVKDVFEKQVEAYGGWDKLERDTVAFRAVNARVNDECSGTAPPGVKPGVYERAVCLVAKYRQHGLAAQFGEL